MEKRTKPVIGVDWGTSRTYPAVVDEDGQCQSLLPSGNHMCNGGIPSLFAYSSAEGYTLCDDVLSEELEIYDPEHVVSSIKMRLDQEFHLDDAAFTGEDIAARVISIQMQYALEELEIQDLDADPHKVVICAPVSFGTSERTRLKNAFARAGYEVIRIIPEPVSAAIFYQKSGTILVLDIGAGTTDAAIVRENPLITPKEPYPYLFVDSTGIAIAGDLFDEKIADYLAQQLFIQCEDIDMEQLLDHESAAYRRLKATARKAKESLSKKEEIGVTFNGREAGRGRVRLTRQEMNQAIHPLVVKIIYCVKTLLERNSHIDEQDLTIIMTGGSSYIPYIREQLSKTCRQISPDNIYVKAPEKAIGLGAAIFASNMDTIHPRVDFSYGVDTYINDIQKIQTLIPAGVELPCTVERDYCTRYEGQTTVSFHLYEYRSREKVLPINDSLQMKVSAATHEFRKSVPKGTLCTARMTLTEDGILMLQVTSDISDHVAKIQCSIFTDSAPER